MKPTDLASLRQRIDEIDRTIHRSLMERATVIKQLIAAKQTLAQNRAAKAAFRPGREAEMMVRLYHDHNGMLPFHTVEHIWREIIGAFTYLQSGYRLIVEGGARGSVIETVRFHLGFASPIVIVNSADEAFDTAEDGDVIVVVNKADTPWWQRLIADEPRQIIARLPTFTPATGQAKIIAYVIAPASVDRKPMTNTIFSLVTSRRTSANDIVKTATKDGELLLQCGDDNNDYLLFASANNAQTAVINDNLARAGHYFADLQQRGAIWHLRNKKG